MLRNKTFMKIISLVIAIILWAYVIQVTNPTKNQKYENIPITIVNQTALEERGLTILPGEAATVTVSVQGKKSEFTKISKNDISASIDVAGLGKGQNTMNVTVSVPGSMTLLGKTPEKVTLTIDKLVSEYKEVVPVVNGQTESGTEIGDVTTDVDKVMVRGAKTLVDSVDHMEAAIDGGGITEEQKSLWVHVVPVDSTGKEVSNITIGQQKVHVTSKLYYTKMVPLSVVTVGEQPGYQVGKVVCPETITIKGSKALLNNISTIEGQIDITGMNVGETTAKLRVNVKLPGGVTLAETTGDVYATVTMTEKNVSEEPPLPQEP